MSRQQHDQHYTPVPNGDIFSNGQSRIPDLLTKWRSSKLTRSLITDKPTVDELKELLNDRQVRENIMSSYGTKQSTLAVLLMNARSEIADIVAQSPLPAEYEKQHPNLKTEIEKACYTQHSCSR